MQTLEAVRPSPSVREAAEQYRKHGVCVAPAIIANELVEQVKPHMEAVFHGLYETGVAPMRFWEPTDPPGKLKLIDQPQVADSTIRDFISNPAIGEWAAGITGASMVQVWAVSMLHKPSGGDKAGGVGWHQDLEYWKEMWEEGSELFTVWLAVSDVTAQSRPVRFVPGSHRWGLIGQSEFSNPDQAPITVPEGEVWTETQALLVPGAASFHHSVTYHGSGVNVSGSPRLGFALHLRTQKSRPKPLDGNPGKEYLEQLDNPDACPVIYRA